MFLLVPISGGNTDFSLWLQFHWKQKVRHQFSKGHLMYTTDASVSFLIWSVVALLKKFREIKSDMFPGPFATSAPGGGIPDVIKAQLEHEEWYHGAVSRENAERLLKNVSSDQIFYVKLILLKVFFFRMGIFLFVILGILLDNMFWVGCKVIPKNTFYLSIPMAS